MITRDYIGDEFVYKGHSTKLYKEDIVENGCSCENCKKGKLIEILDNFQGTILHWCPNCNKEKYICNITLPEITKEEFKQLNNYSFKYVEVIEG